MQRLPILGLTQATFTELYELYFCCPGFLACVLVQCHHCRQSLCLFHSLLFSTITVYSLCPCFISCVIVQYHHCLQSLCCCSVPSLSIVFVLVSQPVLFSTITVYSLCPRFISCVLVQSHHSPCFIACVVVQYHHCLQSLSLFHGLCTRSELARLEFPSIKKSCSGKQT